jgi:hypothetical protein
MNISILVQTTNGRGEQGGDTLMWTFDSITTNQAAIIALFRVMNRYVGNLPPMPGVFPGARLCATRAPVANSP